MLLLFVLILIFDSILESFQLPDESTFFFLLILNSVSLSLELFSSSDEPKFFFLLVLLSDDTIFFFLLVVPLVLSSLVEIFTLSDTSSSSLLEKINLLFVSITFFLMELYELQK
jgi:hypothetical protein